MLDPERATKFYAELFGWKVTRSNGPQEYWLAKTGADSERGINGAFIERTSEIDAVVNTIAVDDLRASLKKVRDCGGTVVSEMTIEMVGRFAYCRDTEGNLFGMLEPAAGR
jgi:predicted enzyme related to lactoylglutathione lyase